MDQIDKYQQKYNELNQQFSSFLYTISHDLQAPLRHIREFTKILIGELGELKTEDQKIAVHFITKSAEQCEAMIAGLLTYSRLNTEESVVEDINIEELLLESKEKYKGQIKEKGISVTWPENAIEVKGDKKQIKTLMNALIENAIKYNKKEGSHINIAVESQGKLNIITVKDNGIGIDPRNQKEIFTIFKKLDPESPGHGIGLALVQKIVENHNGNITLISEPEKGTEFQVSWPKSGQ